MIAPPPHRVLRPMEEKSASMQTYRIAREVFALVLGHSQQIAFLRQASVNFFRYTYIEPALYRASTKNCCTTNYKFAVSEPFRRAARHRKQTARGRTSYFANGARQDTPPRKRRRQNALLAQAMRGRTPATLPSRTRTPSRGRRSTNSAVRTAPDAYTSPAATGQRSHANRSEYRTFLPR